MKNIEAILKEAGIEIPEDKKEAFNKAVNENYKTIAEYNKLTASLTEEKQKTAAATETLKKFDGLDPEAVQKEIADWKQKAIDAEKEYTAKAAKQEYENILAKALDEYKFSSKAARSAIEKELRETQLPIHDGKILGLTDRMEQFKESDASAFAPDKASVPKFTAPKNAPATGKTTKEISEIEDPDERMAAWEEYLSREE